MIDIELIRLQAQWITLRQRAIICFSQGYCIKHETEHSGIIEQICTDVEKGGISHSKKGRGMFRVRITLLLLFWKC